MGFIRKNKGSLVRVDSSVYVGEEGYLFWDVETGCSRLSDGKTPGGLSINGCYGGGGPGGDTYWGNILGTLSNQTDLQAALDAKADLSALNTTNTNVQANTDAITINKSNITDLQTNKEDSLGNPPIDGYILSSLADGTRSWKVDDSGTDENAVWGNITGTLADQTDLLSALNGKANLVHTHVESDITNLDKYTQSEVDSLVNAKEDLLGNPPVDGYILSSLIDGTRSWVEDQQGTDAVWGNITGTLSDQTDLQTELDTKLENIVEDLTPQLGGPLGTEGHNIYVTDSGGLIIGFIGQTSNGGIGMVYSGPGGGYDENDGGILVGPGISILSGAVTQVQSLASDGNRQVYATAEGNLYPVVPPAAGWEVTDLDDGVYSATTAGTWVPITGLEVTFPQDLPTGDRLDVLTNLTMSNSTAHSGTVDVSWGINGSPPTGNGVNTVLEPGFDNLVPISLSLLTHAGYSTGDIASVWVRVASEDDPAFEVSVDGSVREHELTLSVPGEVGSVGAAWGTITGTLSNQSDLQNELNDKEDYLGLPASNGYVLTSQTDGTRSWVENTGTGGGDIVLPPAPVQPGPDEVVDEVVASENLGIKWIYTLKDNSNDDVVSAEILANHQNGTSVTHSRSSIIGARIPHRVDVVLDPVNDLLQLLISNLTPNVFIVNIARIKITN